MGNATLEPNPRTPGQPIRRPTGHDRLVVKASDLMVLVEHWGRGMASNEEIRGALGRRYMGQLGRENGWYGTANGDEVPPLGPMTALAAQTGMLTDTLQKMLTKREYIALDTADRILCAIEQPGALRDGRCPVYERQRIGFSGSWTIIGEAT